MSELVFLKLGGSLITDKRRFETARPAVISRLAEEIRAAREAKPDLQLVLGHGSGSYGHFVADRYRVHQGQLKNWRGYAETCVAAQRLNRLVTDAIIGEGTPVVPLQPSASARCRDGELVEMAVGPIVELLGHGLVPMVYGDVALDEVKGCTIISTEQIFVHIGRTLCPQRIVLAGEVAGVYSGDPQRDAIVRLIPDISSENYDHVQGLLASSFGVDVTGGMTSKITLMHDLIQQHPNLRVYIVSGRRNGMVQRALTDPDRCEGTVLRF